MRWDSVLSTTSEGEQSAEMTVHLTEHEAAMLVRSLEHYLQLMEDAFTSGNADLRAFYEFTPAHYASAFCMVELLERASGMSRERLRQVEWWTLFEQMDAKDWAEWAPHCDRPIVHNV
ncbi:MAG: hypothetical protein AAFY26_21060 [Cyanobacteria bacterium J06638_22]